MKTRSSLVKNLQAVACILSVLAVSAFAIYLGVWFLFIGGIVGVIEAIKATPVSGGGIAWGLFKSIVAWPVGLASLSTGVFITSRLWPNYHRGLGNRG